MFYELNKRKRTTYPAFNTKERVDLRQLEVRNLFAIHFVTECIALKKRKTFCHRIISFMFMHNLN